MADGARFWEATVDQAPGMVVFGPHPEDGSYLTFDADGSATRIEGHRVTSREPGLFFKVPDQCPSQVVVASDDGPNWLTRCVKLRGHAAGHHDEEGREWT